MRIKYLTELLVSMASNTLLVKAAVRKFCLFVAISVWKPEIAALCRIILIGWGNSQSQILAYVL